MHTMPKDSSDFLEQLRGEVSVFQNFSGIFEKCVQEDHLGAVLLVFGDIFRKELGFVVTSELSRTEPNGPARPRDPENGPFQPLRLQGKLPDSGGGVGWA